MTRGLVNQVEVAVSIFKDQIDEDIVKPERIYDVREKKKYDAKHGPVVTVYSDSPIVTSPSTHSGKMKESSIAVDVKTYQRRKMSFKEARDKFQKVNSELEDIFDNNRTGSDCAIDSFKDPTLDDQSDGSRKLFRSVWSVDTVIYFEKYANIS